MAPKKPKIILEPLHSQKTLDDKGGARIPSTWDPEDGRFELAEEAFTKLRIACVNCHTFTLQRDQTGVDAKGLKKRRYKCSKCKSTMGCKELLKLAYEDEDEITHEVDYDEDPRDAVIRSLRDEIEQLKQTIGEMKEHIHSLSKQKKIDRSERRDIGTNTDNRPQIPKKTSAPGHANAPGSTTTNTKRVKSYCDAVRSLKIPEEHQSAVFTTLKTYQRIPKAIDKNTSEVDKKARLRTIYVGGFKKKADSMKESYRILRTDLMTLRFVMSKVKALSWCSATTVEFKVEEDYVGSFIRRMKALNSLFHVYDKYDPSKPRPGAVHPDAAQKARTNFMNRMKRSALFAKNADLRDSYLESLKTISQDEYNAVCIELQREQPPGPSNR